MKKIFGRLALLSALALVSHTASAGLSPEEDTWSIAARFGVAPAVFTKDARFTSTAHVFGSTITEGAGDISSATISRRTAKTAFSKLYTMPFALGFDVGYMTTDCFELFLNFDYAHACSKSVTVAGNIGTTSANTSWEFRDLHNYGFYIGARHYFRPISSILPFVGAKIGIRGNSSCGKDESIILRASSPQRFTRFKGRNCSSLSGGLQLGFDWQIAESYFMTFMSEMVGTSKRHFNSNYQVHKAPTAGAANDNFGLASQVTGNPRGILAFPLTIGLRARL